MKKLLALVALVAMVTVASVAQAATVDVTGSITADTTIDNCTGADFGTMVPGSVLSDTCTGTMSYTDAAGYELMYNATSDDLLNGLGDALEGAATCSIGTECFSYKFDSSDTADIIRGSSTTEHQVPTVATSQAGNPGSWIGNYGFTFYAVVVADSASGTYTSSGTATLSVYVP
jgi:hypothetical protein